MLELIKKIINYGNEHFNNELEIKRNIVSNQIILIFIGGLLFFVSYLIIMVILLLLRVLDFLDQVDIKQSIFFLFLPSLIMILILVVCYYLKNKTGEYTLYLSIAYFSGIGFLVWMNYIIASSMYAFLLFLTLIPVPFFLMGREKARVILIWEVLLLIIVAVTFYYISTHDPVINFPRLIENITNSALFFLTSCIVLASSFYLWYETVITENKLFYERLKTKEALENVEALKFQQDGDFFLISLLTDPLSYQTNESSFIKISSVLKSKKEFWFKNKKKEIGGDLNIIDEIFFGDRRFLFFLNADAMGKSIQGASGALILGAAIKSILLRTKHAQTKQESYPEIWIRNIYVEIQQLFETFGCSMLVSGILGLVEEETGLVYYINAEHPFLILYRDHKASFIDRDFSTRKWGTPGNNEVVQVRLFQMKQNDYLICGSDGKDDILIKQKNNEKILNYNEEYIFKIIESTSGDSSEIFEKILEVAELTDDFSLISIQYLGKTRQYKYSYKEDFIEFQKEIFKEKKNRNYKQAKEICLQMLKEYPFDLNLLKQVVLLSLRTENYEEAINFAKKVLETHPLETRFLFYISYANYKLGDMARAIFYAERAYLREPLNVRYISHLAQLYKLNHEYPKAVIHAKRGLELEPTNTILQKIFRLYDI